MKITRQKRPDRVICKWKNYYVELGEFKEVFINRTIGPYGHIISIPKSEIPNLIKALLEVSKETK